MKSTTGATITGRQNITFVEDVTEEELKQMMEKPDVQKDALHALAKLNSSVIVGALMNKSHASRAKVERLLRVAPEFTTESLSTPQMLHNYGLWAGPLNWEDLQSKPRYFPGRPILVKAKVETSKDSANYMLYDPQAAEKFVTHRAHLVGMDGNDFIVEIDGKTDGPARVPVSETLELN